MRPGRIGFKSEPNFYTIFFPFSKLLVVVLGPLGVEELVSVEDAPCTCFARYGMKINILTCLWIRLDGKLIDGNKIKEKHM